MKNNFDISLPTIPGKLIKFKIQDIKQTAFGSQKTRFNQNKNNLTKKFIQSFNNFHQPSEQKDQQQTDTQSKTNSRMSIKKQVQQQQSFRHIVPQQKKYLLSVFEANKDHQIPIFNMQSKERGFTFSKLPKEILKNDNQSELFQSQKKFVTDNYYFTSSLIRKQKDQKKQDKKKQKISAVFKSQTRNRVYSRIYNSQVPGPGFYIRNQQQKQKIRKRIKSSIQNKSKEIDFKKLKQVISNIVVVNQQFEEEDNQNSKKQFKMQHMFIIDDRDRFGQQKYPIAPRLNVPGPGTYSFSDGIQDKANKVIVVEQQRKLLKQWFNN